MSQKKVDLYKDKKYNRAEEMRKVRRQSLMRKGVVAVVGLVLLGWIGFSAVDTWQSSRPRQMVEIDFQAIDNYMADLAAAGEE